VLYGAKTLSYLSKPANNKEMVNMKRYLRIGIERVDNGYIVSLLEIVDPFNPNTDKKEVRVFNKADEVLDYLSRILKEDKEI